jgi:hypothetical protein
MLRERITSMGIVLILDLIVAVFILAVVYIWSKLSGGLSNDNYTIIFIISMILLTVVNHTALDSLDKD